ncbi:alpha/beta hydrolase family protein [Microbulbifer sp. 2201CG32-9]|uniref:alpha/beta hydrolase family protein n=1 Tax=Microbulbifer sp. 2201CG32-9 TaxID=3232309 RepID=UPI00345BBF9D
MRTILSRFILVVAFLWTAVSIGAQVPLSDLVRHQDIQEVKISPTGSHIAVKKLYEGERVLYFMSLDPLKVVGGLRFSGKEEVGDFYWANNERVVVEVMSRKAALETPISYGSLYAVNYDGTRGKNIFGHLTGKMQTGSRIKRAESTYAHATIIDPLLNRKNEIMVSTSPWARDWETLGEVLKINIYNGVRKRVADLPVVGGRAYTDGNGKLIFADGTDIKNEHEIYKKLKNGWEKVDDPILGRGRPVGIDQNANEIYFEINRLNETEQLVKFNRKANKIIPVLQHEISDIEEIIKDPKDNRPIGVYLNPDYPEESFFDEEGGFAAYFRGLKKAFEGFRIRFTSFTADGKLGVLEVHGDRLPGDYFLANMETKKIDFLISSSNWLDPAQLNSMKAESFITDDKFRIGTYLTFPDGQKEDLPMVVVPHGGPHSRDYWEYSQDAQILSQNGYLVLQVNFRGSTGYGDHFYTAGEREWGGKIQKDIADAVNWAVAEGYADPDLICIYGASFGGYSALMNPIRYPGLYKCAIGFAGVYDLELLYTKGDIKRRDRGLAYLESELTKDKDFLKENSPLHNADKLDLPLFIVHGEKDERVPVEHAKQLLRKLEKEGKPAKSLLVANEGHGFYSEENNLELYTEILAFLDQYIGVGSVEKGNDNNQAQLSE